MNSSRLQTYITRDDRNAIILSPDNYKGISVQVVRYVNQLRPDANNCLVEHRTEVGVWCKTVVSLSPESAQNLQSNPNHPLVAKDGKKFKQELQETIEEAKSYLAKIQ